MYTLMCLMCNSINDDNNKHSQQKFQFFFLFMRIGLAQDDFDSLTEITGNGMVKNMYMQALGFTRE